MVTLPPLTLQGCESLESVRKYAQSTWPMGLYFCHLSQVVDNFENRQGCYFWAQFSISQPCFHFETWPADYRKLKPDINVLGRTIHLKILDSQEL